MTANQSNTATYAIHVNDRLAGRAGFLGTADDNHLVSATAEARRFPTMAAAEAHLSSLKSRRGHFLRESRHFSAFACELAL